jgi:hypothetical protein
VWQNVRLGGDYFYSEPYSVRTDMVCKVYGVFYATVFSVCTLPKLDNDGLAFENLLLVW